MPKILVIDDEADMRFAVRMLLERSGHTVLEADNGEAALSRIDEGVPDLVLLDMRLPGMDGIQILQKIREKQKDLPIIMVTGYGNVELAEQALQLGADHYLSKPFHNKELIDVIGQILRKRGYVLPEPSASPADRTESAPESPLEEVAEDRRSFNGLFLVAMILAGAALAWHFVTPRSNYPVPYSNPAGLVFTDQNLWVADWFSQAIYVHDVHKRDLPLKKTYYLPDVHLTGMAVTGNAVYTADSWAHVLRKHRMDDHLSVVFTVPSPGPSPCSLFWDGKYLWSCDLSTGKIYQHQADDRLTVVASYLSPGKAPVGFFKDDRYAWSMDAKTRMIYERRLDNQLSIVATYQLPEWEEGMAPLACFTWLGNDLWFTRTGKSFIYRRSRKRLHEVKP
jgi:CheY-like chemotaxis protein